MKKSIIISVFSILVFNACVEDFLDRKIETDLKENQVFSSYARIRDFLNNIYNHIPVGYSRIDGSMLAGATDDAEFTRENSAIQNFNNGSWNQFSNPDNQWENMYTGIQKCNRFLENTEGVTFENIRYTDPQTYKTQTNNLAKFRLEARVLRAFFYFELIKRYGDVPLILSTLTPESDLNLPRNSYEECVEFIVNECDGVLDSSIPSDISLPVSWGSADAGRVDKGTVRALKARVLLYAASPLHNSNNSLEKWDKAAAAAIEVFNMNKYNTLHNDYTALFRSVSQQEIIFARRMNASNGFERENYPIGFEGGQSGITPSQNLVDDYEMRDGTEFDWNNPVHAANPYENRDPRLEMTVITNNSNWNGRAVEIWAGGMDGKGKERATKTGYYLKKHVAENLDFITGTTAFHTWIIFRMAEVYLNYAEAMNEAYGPESDPNGYGMTALEALNRVRDRGGVKMPLLNSGQWNKNTFREKVRHERRIELAFEEHRPWDIRRWKQIEPFQSPLRGVEITKTGEGIFNYEPITIESRVFSEKMLLYPIPFSEVVKSPKIVQNPNW
ncbi:RagB/SusD family nutrient uptake outer membrane protein [Echinicola marina]|uniref:RagB/SusD family nutrient uptake outer membrane protein n=1 Tax=Echinicola marina TaxID=2859768 RepID=UPI001CF6A162|nr:RagB/SusD family nutrient uptake outer membrane protein [Echinicola marina]UCS91655.1 RagB/SusD family nutrient uptake outer membrane protein [Echinicola marina]